MIRGAGKEPYAYTYSPTHTAVELAQQFDHLEPGAEDEEADVCVAGRIMARRVFGKLAFFTIQDETGTTQLYLDKKRLKDDFKDIKAWTDAGDIVGARGTVKRTEKGEISVVASEWSMLTKALLPLPDKFKGFTDVSKRYRQRHLDLIVNPEVRATFRTRARVTSWLRRFLDDRGFLEIETPTLNSQVEGPISSPPRRHPETHLTTLRPTPRHFLFLHSVPSFLTHSSSVRARELWLVWLTG